MTDNYKNKIIHGFKFVSESEIPELSCTAYMAEHIGCGAKLLYLAREDTNKTFAIAFRTIPGDSTGVFHILEHSVLCGSEKYPVKEPFVELLKGSLKTFLNAYTFPDKTMYPVSSRNDKDFLNLVDVYMDAVLHPLAVKNKNIFLQEGWHVEFDTDAPVYKGVVYNEMKGAYSSPDDVVTREMTSLLYKNNCYGKDSGGDPREITSLTYDDFVKAHEKYYHPSNSRIILDGAVDIEKTLALLDSYLKDYGRIDVDTSVLRAFTGGYSEKTSYYEVARDADPSRARVCLGYEACDFSDRKTLMALTIISDAIAATNASPFKRAMLDSGLVSDADITLYDGIMENSVMIELKNVLPENCDKAAEYAKQSIKRIAEEGIDRASLSAAFNNFEFRLREQDLGNSPAGINFAISALDTWLYGGDPADALAFADNLKFLGDALDTDYYEKLLFKIFVEPKNSARLTLLPSSNLGEKKIAEEGARLDAYLSSMSQEERDALHCEAEELSLWQKTEDSDEALMTIPSLDLEDINPMPERIDNELYVTGGVPTLFTEVFSRGITYASVFFNLSDLSADELFLASLACDIFKHIPAGGYETRALETEIKSELGSLAFAVRALTKNGNVTPYLQVSASCLDTKIPSLVRLVEKVLLTSDFNDTAGIGRIVKQLKVQLQEAIAESVPFSRAAACVCDEAAYNEYIDGIEFYLKLKELEAAFDEKREEISDKFASLSKKIFTKKRLTISVAAREKGRFASDIAAVFPDGEEIGKRSSVRAFGKKREALVVPSGVAYSAIAGNILSHTDSMHGSFGVVRSLLSYEYLWGEIRVRGGAYGAGFIKRNNGAVGCYSYRDPGPARSEKSFERCPEELRRLADGTDITELIIGAVGDIDPLMTPKVIASLSVSYYLRGEIYADRVKTRTELINTDSDDLLAAADLIEKAFSESAFVVTCGKDKLASLGELDSVIEI